MANTKRATEAAQKAFADTREGQAFQTLIIETVQAAPADLRMAAAPKHQSPTL